jgi:hypothetical protein
LGIATYFYTGNNPLDSLGSAFVANIIGSLIFFWVDLIIFSRNTLPTQWEVLEKATCYDCRIVSRVYRLALTPKYNRIHHSPEYRCEKCSIEKFNKLKERNQI